MLRKTALTGLSAKPNLWKLAGVVIVAMPLLALGLGTRITSPSQQAASAKPPTPSEITAKVERKTVGETIVVNGDVSSARTIEVVASATGESVPVVSDVRVKVGDLVKEGQVLVVVSGRPIIALSGVIPAYRDLQPGMTGTDVTQMQKALRRLGFGTGSDSDGRFGQGTQMAVRKFYQQAGFAPAMTSADADQNLQQAKQDIADARDLASQNQKSDPLQEGATSKGDQSAIKAAERKYQTLLETTGVTVPANELAFAPQFPATVVQSRAKLGAAAVDEKNSKPLLSMGAGSATVNTSIDPDQKEYVRVGMQATIQASDGIEVVGNVDSVADDAEEGVDGKHGYAVVISAGNSLPSSLLGKSVQVTIRAAATAGPVLAVPSSAVFSSADGTTRITKMTPTGNTDVEVEIGATGGGWVEIRPKQPLVTEGDAVVIGSSFTAESSDPQ